MHSLIESKHRKKLGEILVERGLLKLSELDNALEIQHDEKSILGKILIGNEYIRNRELHQAIADYHGVEFVDLTEAKPMGVQLKNEHKDDYSRLQLLPWHDNGEQLTFAVCEISSEVEAWIRKHYPHKEIGFVITSPHDITWTIQEKFEEEHVDDASFKLLKKLPKFTAFKLFSKQAAWVSFFVASLIVAAFIVEPVISFLTLFTVMNFFFFAAITFKAIGFISGALHKREETEFQINRFPIYTILLPMYKESETLPNLIDAIKNLNYPKSKLDVKLVVEADDFHTIDALKALKPPSYFEIIRTPYSIPRTKPKACNYALNFAKGELLTIYDAEDIPHPNQLREVLHKFEHSDDKLACVQARLNYYNYNDNQLTRWFALEYATWFDMVMVGFERLGLPIPLGGTSNHIKTRILKKVGAWDAFNVTEDADLGFRLVNQGYKIATVNSLTLEEAPNRVGIWIMQRTRWIKGFMQTYFIHVTETKSIKAFLTLNLLIGIPSFMFLAAPILLIATAVLTWGSSPLIVLPDWLFVFSILNLVIGALAHITFTAIAADRASINNKPLFRHSLIGSCMTFPIYAFLHIYAAYRAVYQLVKAPFLWEKTEHGLTKNKVKRVFDDKHNVATQGSADT